MRQSIKDRLFGLSPLLAIDRLQHNHVGNNGNTARDFFDPKWSREIARSLKIPLAFFRCVSLLVRSMNSGYLLDLDEYMDMAQLVHDEWCKLLPHVHMPVGLYILLKHVPEYQRVTGIPIGTTSEEPLEHLHRVIRNVLKRHTLTCSLEKAHETLMRYLLLCSSPIIAIDHPALRKIQHSEIDGDLKKLLVI